MTFAAGETTKTLSVTVHGDVDGVDGVDPDEVNEHLLLNVNRPVNVRLADSQGRGTIVDDD